MTFHGLTIRDNNAAPDSDIVTDVLLQDCYRTAEIQQARTVVDVGAHIGAFSRAVLKKFPTAQIVCVEACPENIPTLRANVPEAKILQAALSYSPEPLAMLNAVWPNCVSTGGSRVVAKSNAENYQRSGSERSRNKDASGNTREYWADFRPIKTCTLESIQQQMGWPEIDVLKLDCEGCELDLFANAPVLGLVRLIVGEWHDWAAFEKLYQEKLEDIFTLEILRDIKPGPGLFRLTRK